MKRSPNDLVQHIYTTLLERFGEPIDRVASTAGVPDERGKKIEECGECGMTGNKHASWCTLARTKHENAACKDRDCVIDEVAPPGKEKMVKALKKQKGIDNPWAVAWAAHNKERDDKKNEADVVAATDDKTKKAKVGLAKPGMKKQVDEPIIKEDDIETCAKCGLPIGTEDDWIEWSEWCDADAKFDAGEFGGGCQEPPFCVCQEEMQEAYTGKHEVHILRNVTRPRDPDARAEAFAYCGEAEECSGSGRHGMARSSRDATCTRCIRAYEKEKRSTKPDPGDFI